MKKTIMILAFLGIAIFAINNVNAQGCCGSKKSCSKSGSNTTQTTTSATDTKDTLFVNGACGMCKTRIEKAANGVKGITDAQWDQTTHVLTYAYTGTVKKADVSDAMIKVGHDTGYGKASDKTYNKLPGCCHYR